MADPQTGERSGMEGHMSDRPSISEGQVLMGPLFNEQMRVETVAEGGDGNWVVGLVGVQNTRCRY